MPNFCMVINCGSNGLRDQVGFYRLPSVYDNNKKENSLAKERRSAWIKSLRRADLSDSKLKYGWICSKHFITGKPAPLFEKDHPDWVPSVNMRYQSTKSRNGSKVDRYDRLTKKRASCSSPQVPIAIDVESQLSGDEVQKDENNEILEYGNPQNEELVRLRLEVQNLYNSDHFRRDENFTLYYTSFPEYKYVNAIFDLIEEHLSTTSSLTKFKQFILTRIKLHLNFPLKDLDTYFMMIHTTASKIFYRTADILYEKFKTLIIWPDRDHFRRNVPKCFEQNL